MRLRQLGVDKVEHVNRTEGSNCTSCTLYRDTAGSEVDADPLFVGKHAIANG